ncbi:anti-sigma factor [Nonomuraea angiospora]|uniref:anti-sigma factor n=1 Tax=Nonomuraea angiospora TaxID=46172 RepID=UPI0029AED727|nr:anti-sigma factor [Nonomuraea angiospora]MDX3109113.1 anti-sigma factor [Nonomuraea angiospora]
MMTDDLHALSGAYAVHALPYAEWVLYEEHLPACSACWTEVRRLRETAARLAEAVAEPPPAPLRQRLLDAAHDQRRPDRRQPDQRRPEERPERGSGAVPDDGPTIWWPLASRTPAAPPAAPPAPLRRRRARVTAGLAAVAAAAAVALGAVAVDARRDLSDLTARNDEVIAVLAAPDAETVRRPATSGGTGTVVISRARGRLVFASSGLAELPRSKRYELWLMGPDGPRPAGMLDRAGGGLTAPLLITPERGEDRVALTVEPAAGSGRPTTRPILLAELPEA